MKKIGLIGGMSWESSQVYYQILNERVRELLGGFHSARCVIESVDFAEIEKLQHQNDWDSLNESMVEAAVNLENAKADLIILCTNTMHLCSDTIKDSVNIPFVHIAEATGQKIKASGLQKVLLLGTKFTMEKEFFRDILKDDFGLEVMTPEQTHRDLVHQVIYEELVHGKILPESRKAFQEIINKAIADGSEGTILGCTEIPLLIKPEDVDIATFDTTRIHAERAVELALEE